jgi:hypothetical protein
MKHRRWAAGAVVVVLLAALSFGIVRVFDQSRNVAMDDYKGHPASSSPTPDEVQAAAGATSSPGAGRTAGPPGVSGTDDAASSAGPSGDTGAPAETGGPDALDDRDRPSWDPAAESPEGADEEAKVPGGEGSEPYRLPATPDRKPALTAVPEPAAAEGKLSAGFPEQLVPAPEDAAVQSSSVAPQGRRVLVGLDTLTGQQPEEVVDFYAGHCDDLGWPVVRGPAPDGALQVRCGYGPDALTVTARTLPTGRTAVTAAGAFEVRQATASD